MIPFKEAYDKVLSYSMNLGVEKVNLMNSSGRILAEDIKADRDFPPFNRVTKDGIAISYAALANGVTKFRMEGIASAGMPQQCLKDENACLEVMTGAVLPLKTDTVIMYEHLTIEDEWVVINKAVTQGQNIHYQGSDTSQGTLILKKGHVIGPAEIGVMASVGADKINVQALPRVCTISTGDELVNVNETPEPHQIRKSNSITLQVALSKLGIVASALHLKDDKTTIRKGLENALQENDVLLLSGGVSMGKFDFIPEVMDVLGVEKVFHRVAQRPGKPFWFGFHEDHNTAIFSFPGNPVSTFANYHIYFLPWLKTSWNVPIQNTFVRLVEELQINLPLTRFIQVRTRWKDGALHATPVSENGSGDLTSLVKSDGFICLEPRKAIYKVGELVIFVPTR